VGLAGISYPGFYATACLPGAHPAIKAVSPQAPVTDEFIGDDANHNGAFFLLDNFSFMNFFDMERNGPVKDYAKPVFNAGSRDAYKFYLQMGTIKIPMVQNITITKVLSGTNIYNTILMMLTGKQEISVRI